MYTQKKLRKDRTHGAWWALTWGRPEFSGWSVVVYSIKAGKEESCLSTSHIQSLKAGVAPIKSVIFGGDRFLFFCTKVFLRPRRSVVPSFSAVLRLEVEEKGEERRSFWSTRRRRPRLLYLTRNRHTCQTTRESRVAVAHVVTLYVVVRSWVIDKQAKKMQPAQVVVGEASPGLGLVVVVPPSLMSTSLQRNVSCSSSASRAYASFPTTRTETQTAGVVVRLKE